VTFRTAHERAIVNVVKFAKQMAAKKKSR